MRSSDERGFVTLVAIIIIVIVGLVGTLLYTSLLGEVQGSVGSRQSVGAIGVAEAGANWAGNKLGKAGASTYAGDTNQTVNTAGGTQVGVFDVAVTCTNGAAVSTGCPAQPTARLIASTGYVPSKVLPLGKRKVQIVLNQISAFTLNNAVCSYSNLNFDTNVVVKGNVGSEGNVILQAGPPPGKVVAGGGQPGNVYAVTTIQCDAGCGTQIAGAPFPNQAAGSVCPNKTTVTNSYTCTPGAANSGGGNLTINSANASWNTITINAGKTLTFDTTGLSGPLVVQANSINAGDNSTAVIKGGGSVTLIVNGNIFFGQNSAFGKDFATGNPVAASRMVVESCSTANGGSGEAVEFAQNGMASGVFIVPNGMVHFVQRQSQGAVLAKTIQFDQGQGSDFIYDSSAQNVGLSAAYMKLTSWQDVP